MTDWWLVLLFIWLLLASTFMVIHIIMECEPFDEDDEP